MVTKRLDINKGKTPIHSRKTASPRPVSGHRPFLNPIIYKAKGRKPISSKRSNQSRKQPGSGNHRTNQAIEPQLNHQEAVNVNALESEPLPTQALVMDDTDYDDDFLGDYAQNEEMVLPPHVMEADSIKEEETIPHHMYHTDSQPSILSEPVIPPLPAVYSKNNVVAHPKIAYSQDTNRPLILQSVLMEIWDVQWEHTVKVKWGCEWLWHRREVQMTVKDSRHDQAGSTLLVTGDFVLVGEGASANDPTLRHETVLIPFTSTILRPFTLPKTELIHSPSPLPYPNNIWVQTSDWNVMWAESPLRKGTHEEHGVLCITGRAWWFQKQLLSLDHTQPNHLTKI
ncbi:MAG: hypothetical protein K0R47_4419 [Brevibacillus sp.]|nr:hypothetical protein [Brevibacillus sp.]